jgi:hypothetical protein
MTTDAIDTDLLAVDEPSIALRLREHQLTPVLDELPILENGTVHILRDGALLPHEPLFRWMACPSCEEKHLFLYHGKDTFKPPPGGCRSAESVESIMGWS